MLKSPMTTSVPMMARKSPRLRLVPHSMRGSTMQAAPARRTYLTMACTVVADGEGFDQLAVHGVVVREAAQTHLAGRSLMGEAPRRKRTASRVASELSWNARSD